MKVGIVGCGGMGTSHYLSLKALSSEMDIEIVALADCRKEFLDKAAAHFPNARTYRYGMDLIEMEDLDSVHICLPSDLHVDHAVAAMERGIHVFIEKPVCLTLEEADRLLEAEKRTRVKVMAGQVVRFYDEYQYLKSAYESKRYGELKSIVMQRLSGKVKSGIDDWFNDEKRSGSVVLDLHIHDLDFLRYMLGEPDGFEVRATSFESGMINQIVTIYEFGNLFATAEGIWDVSSALDFDVSFRACFEKATIVYHKGESPALVVYKEDGMAEVPEYGKKPYMSSISDLGAPYIEDKYFFQYLLGEKNGDIAPLSEGVKSVRLALREWEAAKAYVKEQK